MLVNAFMKGLLMFALFGVDSPGLFIPGYYASGDVPQNQVAAIGGGQVLLSVSVSSKGDETKLTTLRMTPPFTDAVRAAVQRWHFVPAQERVLNPTPGTSDSPWRPVQSEILVAAVFRPPTINTPTFGMMPRDVASASETVAFPSNIVEPPFPVQALFDGVVLVEVLVGTDGQVKQSRIVKGAVPFDQASLDAVNRWTFRPARVHGVPVKQYVYVIFGFRQPITIRRK